MQPVPASLEHILEFEFAGPPLVEYADGKCVHAHRIAVVGPHTQAGINIRMTGRVESFAIFFQPLGLRQLLRIPIWILADTSYSGADLLGRLSEDLWEQLAEAGTFKARVTVAERYLLWLTARASGRTPIMNAALHLFQRHGLSSIRELASSSGLSVRHFERRFVNEMGIRPKLFGRISRFQTALDAKLRFPDRNWLAIAHQFGYHDQMHMIRDFRDLGGAAPGQMLSELGDTRPPALASATEDD